MKQIIISTFLGILIACSPSLTSSLNLNSSDIKYIEVYKVSPENKIQMKEGFEKEFIADLNKSKELGPTKYGKTYRLIIHYINKETDIIPTNGSIYEFKNLYKSETNLIEKYAIKQPILSDSIEGQLKTVEKLQKFMSEKKYDEAILLFSKKQQKNILEFKNEKELFSYWCLAWTLNEAQYERYTKRIVSGKGIFVFEENEWKIDEK